MPRLAQLCLCCDAVTELAESRNPASLDNLGVSLARVLAVQLVRYAKDFQSPIWSLGRICTL